MAAELTTVRWLGDEIVIKLIKIAVLENEIQAQVLEGLLKERKIPYLIRSYHDSAYDGLFQSIKGWGHIEAPVKYKEEVLSIIEQLNSDKLYSVKHIKNIPKEKVKAGTNTYRQVLIGSEEGPNCIMRRFIINPGGEIPPHTNMVEHEQYVLRGSAQIGIEKDVIKVEKDDVVFIPAGIPHWYKTEGDEPFEFLCIVPNIPDKLQMVDKK